MTDIKDLLPALSIRRHPGLDLPAILLGDVDICLDCVPLKGVQELTLSLANDDVNRMTIDFAVRDVDIDPDFLVALEAHVKEKVAA